MTNFRFPDGWCDLPLSDVGEWMGGGTPSKAEPRFWEGTIPWVSPKDMKIGSIFDTEDHISMEAVEGSAVRIIPQGSVLFVTRSGILSHSFPVATTKNEVTINQDIKAIVPLPFIDSEFLAWTLRASSRAILNRCTKHGTTVHSIEVSSLKSWKIGIPPISEQHRIVAKIEALFSKLDKGIEALKTAREQLKVYRQAVLKHAFEGKLTARWREENPDKLESPEQLLTRIQQVRKVRYQQQLEDWKMTVKALKKNGNQGKKPRRPKAPVVVPCVTADELYELPVLPQIWMWVRPEQIAAEDNYAIGIGPFGSNLKVSDYRDAGVPLIFVSNITRKNFSSNLKYIDHVKFHELSAHWVMPLDLVITKMGDPQVIAKYTQKIVPSQS